MSQIATEKQWSTSLCAILYIPLISPSIPGCGWLLDRLKAAEIKVRHQAVGADDSVSMQVQQTFDETGRHDCIPKLRDSIMIASRIEKVVMLVELNIKGKTFKTTLGIENCAPI